MNLHRDIKRLAAVLGVTWFLTVSAAADLAPQPVLTDLQGEILELQDYRGRVVLLNFWATWCAPCLREMPELDQASRQIDPGRAAILGIAADDPTEAARFAEELQVGYRIASGEPDAVFAWTAALGNMALGLPFSVILDTDGEIRWHKSGGTVTAEEVVGLLEKLILEEGSQE